jgi:hypothetical protein
MDRYWRCLLRKCTRNILRPEDRDADVPKFSHPSFLFFFTSLLTTVLLFPVLLLVLISPSLKTAHAPLLLIPLLTTMATLLFTILSNYLVRRAHTKESQRVVRMLTDAAGSARREGDEAVARALVGLEAPGVWNKIVGFFSGIIGLVAGLASLIIVTVSLQVSRTVSVALTLPVTPHRPIHYRLRRLNATPFHIIQAHPCQASGSALVYTSSSRLCRA